MHRLITLMQKDEERMEILSIVRSLELVDCYVAAGFVRNLVWDWLHGIRTPVNDVDIVFFDNTDSRNLSATKHQAALMAAYIEAALDRISNATNIDEQVEKEIRRYWNDQVQQSPNKKQKKRIRLIIARVLSGQC